MPMVAWQEVTLMQSPGTGLPGLDRRPPDRRSHPYQWPGPAGRLGPASELGGLLLAEREDRSLTYGGQPT